MFQKLVNLHTLVMVPVRIALKTTTAMSDLVIIVLLCLKFRVITPQAGESQSVRVLGVNCLMNFSTFYKYNCYVHRAKGSVSNP